MFTVIANFFKNLFGNHNKCYDEQTTGIQDTNVEKEEDPIAEESTLEESCGHVESDTAEDEVVSEEEDSTIATFTEEEKDIIVNFIRPIVKKANNSKEYDDFLDSPLNTDNSIKKLLKTFSKLSDDYTTITIKFTQNKAFNKMSNPIVEHFAEIIKNEVSQSIPIDVFVADGEIVITKK